MSTGDAASTESTQSLERVLGRYREALGEALRPVLRAGQNASQTSDHSAPVAPETARLLDEFYGQMEYHHGWRAPDLQPKPWRPGKLIRPTLLLLACEVAVSTTAGKSDGKTDQERSAAVYAAIPAALAVELVHNFSLVHDDIEDGDEERHHLPTLWKLVGVPQAINTGDGIFALAHLQLSHLHERGVPAETVVRLSALLDSTCVELCEGQYLDMRFEGRRDVSVTMYLDMIGRKTAALMACATRMGSLIGDPANEALGGHLGEFGRALGVGFQLRDDMLGIWSAAALGKTAVGDLRRKKMSLPVIAALEAATAEDARTLTAIYDAPGPATEPQIEAMLAVLERTGARERSRAMLRETCDRARGLLESACATSGATDACAALGVLLDFVAAEGI